MPDAAPALSDPLTPTSLDADGAMLEHRLFDGQACTCPLCTGQVTLEDTQPAQLDAPQVPLGDVFGPQDYLNADDRAAITNVEGKPSFTIDRAALQLTGYRTIFSSTGTTLVPERGWSAQAGLPFTVTYGFRATQPFDMPSDTAGFSRFNSTQIFQAEEAIKAWSDVANITFVRVGAGVTGDEAYTDDAAILFSNYSSGESGASAFSYYPGSTLSSSRDGDVWVNSTIGRNSFPGSGDVGGHVLVHEIGHAIGLSHPGAYNAGDGKTFTYADAAEYYEDSRQYTVMSYFSETNTGGNFGGRYPAAPMLDDIAGAQLEYGANMSTRTGDTTYGFNSNADRSWYWASSGNSRVVFAVWDAGGNDTFDFSGYGQAQTIDLREGNFSNVGGLVGNVAVAKGAQIENAFGGSGADLITGNALNNVLIGAAGADSIFGGAGNDYIDGGEGASFLRGEDGNDTILGGASFDDIHGMKGDDTEAGGFGDDWVVGGQGNDTLAGDDGADIVFGNIGDDFNFGGAGDDIVRGGQNNDYVNGGDGNDFLSGDRGDDTISGGAGADVFHTSSDAGLDYVVDFNPAEGDRVMLEGVSSYTVTDEADGVHITMATSKDVMVLLNVKLSSLPPGWIFGI